MIRERPPFVVVEHTSQTVHGCEGFEIPGGATFFEYRLRVGDLRLKFGGLIQGVQVRGLYLQASSSSIAIPTDAEPDAIEEFIKDVVGYRRDNVRGSIARTLCQILRSYMQPQ